MDVNLTHAIAANITLMQPSSQNNSTLLAFVSGALVTLVVAFITAYVSYKIARENINASEKIARKNERQEKSNKMKQADSELMGRQHTRMQVYAAYFSAQINANYYDLLSIVNAISRIDYSHVQTISEFNAAFIHERVNSIFYNEQ
jgi:mannitol-specific phosphotransferase system IIBC component